MSKNKELDKFYTPIETAQKCIELLLETIPFNITEFMEPSAGNGSFSNLIDDCIAYDIEPENDKIVKADFLKLEILYKKGRIIFGNPPFGDRNNLSRSFYKKSIQICDAIGFILPISQLNNSDSLYEFDLIKSIDLGVLEYSNMKIHCCFNVFLRPLNGLNKKPNHKLDLITIYRSDQKDYFLLSYDLCVIRRGEYAGRKSVNPTEYADTFKIIINDKSKIDFVKSTILNFDWKNYKKHQSGPSISKNDIYRLFK